MGVRLQGIPEEIQVGDIIETELGVGVVTHITPPVRTRDDALFEIDLGKKWIGAQRVRAIVAHRPEYPHRAEPEMHWDEHE